MDLSGQELFRRSRDLPRSERAGNMGEALLASAWAALASARAEQVELHLDGGFVVPAVRCIRLLGRLAETGPAPGCFTHAFDVESLRLVEIIPRGGRR